MLRVCFGLPGMESIANKFLCCYPLDKIDWQELHGLSWEQQFELLNCTVLNPLNIKHPVKRSYQYAFLKNLVKSLEANGEEVHDAVYEHLAALCRNTSDLSKFTYKHYLLPSEATSVTLKESNSFISEGTTGLCSWQASLALSEWILANRDLFTNKVILELGAGTGLSGIVLAKCCQPKKIILSDGSAAVVKLLEENVAMNFDKTTNIQTCLLQWEDETALALDVASVPDILLGADITYDRSVFPALIGMLNRFFELSGDSCIFYLAATIRNEDTFATFIEMLETESYTACQQRYVKPGKHLYWDESTPIRILSVTRSPHNGMILKKGNKS